MKTKENTTLQQEKSTRGKTSKYGGVRDPNYIFP